MKKLFAVLFPLQLHMTILQLEGYDLARLGKWIFRNYFLRFVETKKKLVITQKVKIIYFLMFISLVAILSFSWLASKNPLILAIEICVLVTHPFLLFFPAILLLKPYEIVNKQRVIALVRNVIISSKKLTVIGITGSYGKSSTKEILFHLIKDSFLTLRTPESYNTVFGIARVVNLELNPNYEVFICEMAAYQRGEIKELTYMIPPKYAILTGISEQHLERFGSLENIKSAKFELVDAVNNKDDVIVNLDSQNVINELKKRRMTNIKGYALQNPDATIKAENVMFSPAGTTFTFVYKGKKYPVKTRLFGSTNVSNILGAAGMALMLGVKMEKLVERIQDIEPFPHRFVLNRSGNATVVDNTFSSNPAGFNETINTAREVKGVKVLVTPGLVELGAKEEEIHLQLGLRSERVFDRIVLVGNNQRTQSFFKGSSNSNKVEFIEDKRKDYAKKVEELTTKYDWIFLENDITQNY